MSPQGIPSPSSEKDVAPLSVKRIKRAPIEKIGIFRSTNVREDRDTGEKYEIEQVNLSIDWNSGHIQRNSEGDPVLDKDGNEQIHYINDGFITLSGDKRSNLVKILKAIGFDSPEFIEQDGSKAGGLRDDLDIQLLFGTNGLGHNYEGCEYDELPLYVLRSKGGKHAKRDVEVPVKSFTIEGIEVIGRACELVITEKNGWNRVEAYVPLENPEEAVPQAEDLDFGDETPFDQPKSTPKRKPIEETEPDPTSKHGIFVQKMFESVNLSREDWTPVIRFMLGDPSVKNLASITVDQARIIRGMYKDDPTVVNKAYKELHPEDAAAEEDEEFDFDEQF